MYTVMCTIYTVGLTNPRIIEPSGYRTLGLTNPRVNEPSDYRPTIALSALTVAMLQIQLPSLILGKLLRDSCQIKYFNGY